MYFADLQRKLLEYLRTRLYNGEITERSLARAAGISQPHVHNALKGLKTLSPELCDRILETLGISVLDLLARDDLLRHAYRQPRSTTWIRVLDGALGPGQGWPVSTGSAERFHITPEELAGMAHPVAARLAADPAMSSAFSEGDWVILDQAIEARRQPVPDALYLVKHGSVPLIRRVRLLGDTLYLVTEESLYRPQDWVRVRVPPGGVTALIHAKAHLVTAGSAWPEVEP